MGQGDMERNEYIRQLVALIHDFRQKLRKAARQHDVRAIGRLTQGYRMAEGDWLQIARGLSLEKTQGVIAAQTLKLTTWVEGDLSQLPPTVLTLYDGALSDAQFSEIGKQRGQL